MDRAERERIAYDEHRVFEESDKWHARVPHVLLAPNTLRGEERFADLARRHAEGGRVLDVGCGRGQSSRELLELGAASVHGVDVSEKWIAYANEHAGDARLSFSCTDVTRPFHGVYDLLYGRSILHHIDYRPFLERVYRDNLAPGGALLFMEPSGANLITMAFHKLVRSAHTPDERPFHLDDLRWLRRTFPDVELVPINFLTFPVGIASSVLLRRARPDNLLMRATDAVDRFLERRLPWLVGQARQLVVVVRKPAPTGAEAPQPAPASTSA